MTTGTMLRSAGMRRAVKDHPVARMTWHREFDEPIPLPNGKTLATLSDARAYILKLKQTDQDSETWQTAAQALLLVANQNGPTMFARIAMMLAL
jgi:hypothetical protein